MHGVNDVRRLKNTNFSILFGIRKNYPLQQWKRSVRKRGDKTECNRGQLLSMLWTYILHPEFSNLMPQYSLHSFLSPSVLYGLIMANCQSLVFCSCFQHTFLKPENEYRKPYGVNLIVSVNHLGRLHRMTSGKLMRMFFPFLLFGGKFLSLVVPRLALPTTEIWNTGMVLIEAIADSMLCEIWGFQSGEVEVSYRKTARLRTLEILDVNTPYFMVP